MPLAVEAVSCAAGAGRRRGDCDSEVAARITLVTQAHGEAHHRGLPPFVATALAITGSASRRRAIAVTLKPAKAEARKPVNETGDLAVGLIPAGRLASYGPRSP